MAENGNSLTSPAGVTAFGDKVKLYSEHIKGILTLSSASLPIIVALLGQLIGKDSAGHVTVPDFVKSGMWLVIVSLLAFLVSILSGVFYSFFLCIKVEKPSERIRSLDVSAFFVHLAFAAGVVSFFAWACLMIWNLP